MPASLLHEGWVLLFRNRPELAPELVRDVLGIALPAYTEARIESGELTDVVPAQRYADVVVLLVEAKPVYGIIVEVQLDRDDDKLYSWPVYAANLRARIRCPVDVLVVTPDPAVARWAARDIETGRGPGSRCRPLVVGPDGMPFIDDPERAARDPELAVLSAIAHGATAPVDDAVRVATVALGAAATLDFDRGMLYSDLVLTALNEAARTALEALMTQGYEYQSEWALRHRAEGEAKGEAKGRAKGKAEGEVRALLTVLEVRGLAVSSEQRERILGCTDLTQIEAWLRKALVATAADELFTG